MADRTVARRYARAFIEIADEHGAIDRLNGELEAFLASSRAEGGELFNALANPVFTVAERIAVLQAVLPRLRVHPLTSNLLCLLVEKGRFSNIPEITEIFGSLADERAGRARVLVETAEPMSAQLEAEVRAALERVTRKQVVLETHVDKSLIGGMVAHVGSKVYDASVRARLEDIRQRLIAGQVPAEA
jgi:F-type H+-transporting ATPase subunit delta